MTMIEVKEAKRTLSKLVKALQSGEADEFILTIDGVPQARLLPIIPEKTKSG